MADALRSACCTPVPALSRWAVGLVSGVLAEQLGFVHYFLLTFAIGVPAYGLLPWIRGAGVANEGEEDRS